MSFELPTTDDPARVIHGETLAVLQTIPTGCADAVVTDPPYSSGGAFRGDRMADTETKYVCDHGVNNFHPGFSGSGTTGKAAILEGRRCVLIEQDPHFAQVSREAVAEGVSEVRA